ncbi:MAG: metallophosphoesterase [Oscillospiraceae bacterium]|nr:metallophosphoesterase [Oscillospiraceae bacterium]
MHYVMADLHGEYDRYRRMLVRTGFSAADTLYILGDVVDRGGVGGVDILLDVMKRGNVVMLLGNHEAMCLKAIDQPGNERAVNHWRRNGGQVTYDNLFRLSAEKRERVLDFLRTRPDHLDLELDGRRFHLVHGFPADNTYDRIWLRPGPEAVSPFPDGRTVVAGHTPVCELWGYDDEEMERYLRGLPDGQLRIFHGKGYIDLDCACGYGIPQRRLACLRLEDMAEFYE